MPYSCEKCGLNFTIDFCSTCGPSATRKILPMYDPINHPFHYTSTALEVINVIENFSLGYCLGNVMKYILRAGKKVRVNELEDLKKAAWYLQRHIEQRSKELKTAFYHVDDTESTANELLLRR